MSEPPLDTSAAVQKGNKTANTEACEMAPQIENKESHFLYPFPEYDRMSCAFLVAQVGNRIGY
ncbi:hypothetical protein Poly41_19870 [Novipirellula artificiosorum]|uniref:Uncharacterized protein n=1 Tax=Novipirellula artificiosorum TaxID=2528016 RepID=A0A5C6E1X8_9BACT|nr:hypothetical protein Poly41_19870 [Novipirellula artificiosorum]